jgi:DNA-binding PadR family transcriptional regulator
LFPALHRLEQDGFIRGRWTTSTEGRRVKTYEITPDGRRQLTRELDQWARVVLAITQVLQTEH